MKRAEMILKIANLISGHDYYYGSPDSKPTEEDFQMANKILDKLEDSGMSYVNKIGQAQEWEKEK